MVSSRTISTRGLFHHSWNCPLSCSCPCLAGVWQVSGLLQTVLLGFSEKSSSRASNAASPLVSSCLTEAGQLSQSAHFSLQLPYTVLGLGRSANFLDHLYVGVPRQTGETVRRQDMMGCQSQVLTQPVWVYICTSTRLGFASLWLLHKGR